MSWSLARLSVYYRYCWGYVGRYDSSSMEWDSFALVVMFPSNCYQTQTSPLGILWQSICSLGRFCCDCVVGHLLNVIEDILGVSAFYIEEFVHYNW